MPDFMFEEEVIGQLRILRRELALLSQAISRIAWKENAIMAQQDDLNALVQELQTDAVNQDTALTAIKAGIAALQQANPGLDLSGLQSAVSALDAQTSAEMDTASGLQVQQTA